MRLPYLGLSLTLFVIAGAVSVFRLPRVPSVEGDAGGGTLLDALRVRHLALGAAAIFVYVGAEVSIGSFMVNFLERPEIGGLSPVTAARHVSFYWGGAMVGRFAGSLVLRRVDAGRLLAGLPRPWRRGSCAVAIVSTGPLAMGAILAVGVCNSIMFPTIFTLGIDGLGKLTSRGSSLLVMSVVGGAVVPVLVGLGRRSLRIAEGARGDPGASAICTSRSTGSGGHGEAPAWYARLNASTTRISRSAVRPFARLRPRLRGPAAQTPALRRGPRPLWSADEHDRFYRRGKGRRGQIGGAPHRPALRR